MAEQIDWRAKTSVGPLYSKRLKSNLGDTSEGRGGALMGFPEHLDTFLN